MTIPDYQSLMRPLLEALVDGGECQIGDLARTMAARLKLSDSERAQLLPSGRQTLIVNRTHWAATYLVKALLIERTRRGVVRLSDRGREALRQKQARIDNKYLTRYPEFRGFVGSGPQGEPIDHGRSATSIPQASIIDTPDERVRAAQAEIESALRADLLQRILAATPEFFERLVVSLLKSMGYGGQQGVTASAIGRSGDGGIDGVIDQDALGLDRVYIQAKRYGRDNSVGPNAIRDFYGSLDLQKAAKGVFITTSSFSRSATETAERLGKRIVLIDGDRLAALLVRYDVGVRTQETFVIKKIDEDLFLDE